MGVPHTSKLEQRDVPETVALSLQHIMHQLDVLTQTVSIIEDRLSMLERKESLQPQSAVGYLTSRLLLIPCLTACYRQVNVEVRRADGPLNS